MLFEEEISKANFIDNVAGKPDVLLMQCLCSAYGSLMVLATLTQTPHMLIDRAMTLT